MQLAASLDTPLVPELLFERTECRTWAIPPDCFLIFIFHPAILRIPQQRLAVIVFCILSSEHESQKTNGGVVKCLHHIRLGSA